MGWVAMFHGWRQEPWILSGERARLLGVIEARGRLLKQKAETENK